MSYIGNLNTHRGLVGKIGEDLACLHLLSLGHKILERNYRIRLGEVDIISTINNTLNFIEVKTTQSTLTTPIEHIDRKKILKMKKVAEFCFNQFISKSLKQEGVDRNKLENTGICLGFVGVTLDDNKKLKKIEYLDTLEI